MLNTMFLGSTLFRSINHVIQTFNVLGVYVEQMVDHDDVIKWKHFPRYWPFVRGIHRSPVNSTHKGQGRGALVFSLICAWTHGWVNNREAGDLRLYLAHYDVTAMEILSKWFDFNVWDLDISAYAIQYRWCNVAVLDNDAMITRPQTR